MGGLIIYCILCLFVVCKVAKYLRSAFDRNHFVDGTIGFIDDYIKIFKKDKQGLKGIFKAFAGGLGLIVDLFFSPAVTVRTDTEKGCFRVTTENNGKPG
jgi:UDP-N-acetylmuramyl pentapeptide phosphotransferase/UDP-N-acetylglucosamine-1-phosphate transferase